MGEPVLFNQFIRVVVGACTGDFGWTDDVPVPPLFAISPECIGQDGLRKNYAD